MKKLAKMLVAALLLGIVSSSASAEILYDWTASGSYSVGKTSTIKMPEDGEVYLKLSGVKAGGSYTFVAAGFGAMVEVVYTYKEEGDIWDTYLAMGDDDVKTANQNRCIVDYESWTDSYIVIVDPEDREYKVTPTGYYLHVMGDAGETITVTSSTGAVPEPIPVGDIENPKMIAPVAAPTTLKANFIESDYFVYMNAKIGTYLFSTSGGTPELPTTLTFDSESDAYTITDVSDQVVSEGNAAYLVKVTKAGRVNFRVSGGELSFGLTYQFASEGSLGRVTVTTVGVDGKWSVKGASGTYASGETVAILGEQTIVFSKITGFTTPANQVVVPTEDDPEVEIVGVYKDTFDPKDDVVTGATKISPSAKGVKASRTLFDGDDFDHFAFTAKDGVYYNFALADLVGDATMTIFKKGDATETTLAGADTAISKFSPGKGDYIIRVAHADPSAGTDAQYTLEATSANVGAISLSKTAVSVKKSAGKLDLTVNRSASEGKVRVRYGTVNGTAQPGVDYVAQNGELVWEDGDKKAKTITIRLIPELFAEEAISRQFSVRIEALPEDEIAEDEYQAVIAAGKDEAVVTVTEAKGKAEAAVKAATVKTEAVPLETGTYQGVIVEDGSALTNGFPALASVTFTAKDVTKTKTKGLSAKVALAGKNYTFTADKWSWYDITESLLSAELIQIQKVNNITYTNVLEVTVKSGETVDPDDWKEAGASVVLTMNVPDANNKGVQEEVVYSGELFRDNAKIQDYLYAVTNAVGYYTISLVPSGVSAYDGIPAGNGYLTLKIDNKGKAKFAGKLADGTTNPSYSSNVAIRDGGETMYVPVFLAKSPACFGGTLKFVRGKDGKFVVDSSMPLIWNNDNALLTYDGEDGWRIALDPVGGYFNTVNNLQAYYLTSAFSVSTADITEFPTEALTAGYEYVTDVQPNGFDVSVDGNAISTAKKSLKKVDGLYDFENSVNPCNVQVKLARATGLVTGGFSLWSENEEGKQKEITGIKHYGVLLLARDEASPLDPEVMTSGFFNQTATIKYTVVDSKGKESNKTRKYTASMPFNVMAVDQGDPDWYADDWGEAPVEE